MNTKSDMTASQAADILRQHNAWRRGDDESVEMVAPALIGRAIDVAIAALAQPSQEPVYYSITVNGHHCGNFWPIQEEAEAAAKRLNASYPQDSRAVVPLFTHPQPSAPVAQEWITREQAMRMVATGLPTADLIKQAFSMGAALRLDQFSVDNLLRIAQSENVTAMRNALSNVARALKAERHVLTDGYVLMPRELTAENSAKAALSGEFAANIELQCHECAEVGEICEDCEVCGGSVPISPT